MEITKHLIDAIKALPPEDQAFVRTQLSAQLDTQQRVAQRKKITLRQEHSSVALCKAYLIQTLNIRIIPNPQVFNLDGQYSNG